MPLALTAPISQKGAQHLKGIQKAAILMVILKEDASAEVLKQMDDSEVQRIGREIARIPSITSEMAEAVLSEFYEMIVAQDYVLKGGIDYARKVLTTAFGGEYARKLIERVTKSLSSDNSNFDALQKADPQQLANFIQHEHPQTISLILSHLGPTQAARLLGYLPVNLRADVALRMASLDQISPEIITKIAIIIGDKLKALGEINRETYGGIHAVAEMFNRLDQIEGKNILETMAVQRSETVRDDPPFNVRLRRPRQDRSGRHPGSPGTGGSQGPLHCSEGYQRHAEEPLPGCDVQAWSRNAA